MLHALILAAALSPSPLIVVSPDAAPLPCPVVVPASDASSRACGEARIALPVVVEGDGIARRAAPAPVAQAAEAAPMRLQAVVSYALDQGRPVTLSVETSPDQIHRDLVTLRSAAAVLEGPGTSWQTREY
jgi:hypothetical protein